MMSNVFVTWLEGPKGYTDIIPLEWLTHAPQDSVRHWFFGEGGYVLNQAQCKVRIRPEAVELDYSGSEDRAFNDDNDVRIGTLRITLRKHKQNGELQIPKVYWRDQSESKFTDCKVLVAYADDDSVIPEFATKEGRQRIISHTVRERSPGLAQRKIASLKKQGNPIICEICRFDYEAQYGSIGKEFCEVHHKNPLASSYEVETRLKDLAILCSNCHRMIHRTNPFEDIDTFRKRLREKP